MNKVVLVGRLTKDPNLTFAPGNGTAVCKFGVAVSRPFKKGESDFINCIAFGKTGESIGQYMQKGKEIALSGRIQTGNYDKADGTKVYTTDVVVENFEFVGSKGNGSNNTNNNNKQQNFDDDITPVDDSDMPF